MAIYQENLVKIELITGNVYRSFSHMAIGEGDGNGNVYGIIAMRNGAEEDLTGSACIGYFIRPDGVTLILNGVVEGNKAYVMLPEAAYTNEGCFTLTIKLSEGGNTNTVRIVDGTIVNTTTGAIMDPAEVIPDLSDYEEVVEAAEEAAETINALSVAAVQISGTRYKITVTKEE